MTENDQAAREKKEAMKQLRAQRKKSIHRAAARVKVQRNELKLLREQVSSDDGATAPEISEAINLDVSKVIWYLATLKQYGEVVEGTKDGCFFRYKLVQKEN
jgi:predicted transcriptional regulator